MKTTLEIFYKRLHAWEAEKESNQNGMAHLADRAIKILKEDIACMEDIVRPKTAKTSEENDP